MATPARPLLVWQLFRLCNPCGLTPAAAPTSASSLARGLRSVCRQLSVTLLPSGTPSCCASVVVPSALVPLPQSSGGVVRVLAQLISVSSSLCGSWLSSRRSLLRVVPVLKLSLGGSDAPALRCPLGCSCSGHFSSSAQPFHLLLGRSPVR